MNSCIILIGGEAPTYSGRERIAVSRSVYSNPIQNERQLVAELLDLQERDRKLLAYEIHDGFVQKATAALMHLQAYRAMPERRPEEAWSTFDSGVRSLAEAVDEARRLMAGLRPPVLDEAGVVAAIEYLTHEELGREGPAIEFCHDVRFDRLPPLLETTLFRAAQEGLTNASRHSRSEKVRVSLVQVGDCVRLEVQDWGTGFDLETIDKTRFGIRSIQERGRLLGGEATIESSPGWGTRVIVELPLEGSHEG
jgi:signal transduction histidine kinase